MQISVAEAEDRLSDLVRRAEAGEAIILTKDGRPIVRLEPIGPAPHRRAVLDGVRRSGAVKASAEPEAARSQDFLYGEDGLPM